MKAPFGISKSTKGRVKRLPVMRDGRLVGIVSRANLVHAVIGLARDAQAPVGDDVAIRSQVLEALGSNPRRVR
jgi:hypothetical protein